MCGRTGMQAPVKAKGMPPDSGMLISATTALPHSGVVCGRNVAVQWFIFTAHSAAAKRHARAGGPCVTAHLPVSRKEYNVTAQRHSHNCEHCYAAQRRVQDNAALWHRVVFRDREHNVAVERCAYTNKASATPKQLFHTRPRDISEKRCARTDKHFAAARRRVQPTEHNAARRSTFRSRSLSWLLHGWHRKLQNCCCLSPAL